VVAHVPLVDERLRILTGAEQRTILRLLRLRESNPAVSVFANSDDVWLVAWLTVILRKPLAGSLFSAAAAAPTARHLRYHRLLHSSFYLKRCRTVSVIASAAAKRAARAKRRPPPSMRARVLALPPLPLLLRLRLLRPPLLLGLLVVVDRYRCVIVAPASRRIALFCRWRASRAPAAAAVVAIIAMILSWCLICAICSIVPLFRQLQLLRPLPRPLRPRPLAARHPLRPLAVVRCLVLASRSSLQRCRRRLVVPMEGIAVLWVAATAAVVATSLPALIRILTSMMMALPPLQVRVRAAVRSPTVGRIPAVAMVPILVWRSQNAISGVPLPGA
jgi:hypothetical protein